MKSVLIAALCLSSQANAGIVYCAGKAYGDIVAATVMPSGNFAIVKLWTAPVHDSANFSIIINMDTMCEFEWVPLRVLLKNETE
jgi:hypothetical protein